MSSVPLCVDLDGTLLAGDITWEATKRVVRRFPWVIVFFPWWAIHGRPFFKRKLAERVTINPSSLSYHEEFVTFLKNEHAQGRRVVLATAADARMVEPIVRHFSFLDPEVIATDTGKNLSGRKKAEELVRRFGEKGFDYAGNERRDVAVWKRARKAIVVNAPAWVKERAQEIADVERVFP